MISITGPGFCGFAVPSQLLLITILVTSHYKDFIGCIRLQGSLSAQQLETAVRKESKGQISRSVTVSSLALQLKGVIDAAWKVDDQVAARMVTVQTCRQPCHQKWKKTKSAESLNRCWANAEQMLIWLIWLIWLMRINCHHTWRSPFVN